MLVSVFANVFDENISLVLQNIFVKYFRSTYEDWRPNLGSLLQPIPFPDEYVFFLFHIYF